MILLILNKIFFVLFFLSCLNIVKNVYLFIQTWFIEEDGQPKKYKISETSLLLLALSIADILMSIFTGIKI